jgi:hypothetical protein
MSITSSSIVGTFPQTSGVVHVYEEHIASTGQILQRRYHARIGDDLNANLSAAVAGMNEILEHQEVDAVVGQVREGAALAPITFDEQTDAIGRARVVKTMLRSNVHDVVIISRILDDYTDNQIQALLGVNLETYNRIKTMMLKARAIESDLADVVNDPDRSEL